MSATVWRLLFSACIVVNAFLVIGDSSKPIFAGIAILSLISCTIGLFAYRNSK